MGKVVLAASFFYDECTNMAAEFRALLDGLRLVQQYDLLAYKIFIECESLVLVNSVMGRCVCAWPFLSLLRQIEEMLNCGDFQVSHVYREANVAADRSVQLRQSVDFSGPLSMPCDVKLALFQDMRSLPVLRTRRFLVYDDMG